jgi:hypothetical protein
MASRRGEDLSRALCVSERPFVGDIRLHQRRADDIVPGSRPRGRRVRPRMRDGRAGPRAPDGPARAAAQELRGARPGEGPALFGQAVGRLLSVGRREIRVVPRPAGCGCTPWKCVPSAVHSPQSGSIAAGCWYGLPDMERRRRSAGLCNRTSQSRRNGRGTDRLTGPRDRIPYGPRADRCGVDRRTDRGRSNGAW